MSDQQQASHTGTCFCGAVQITVTGAPFAMGYCHCHDCRHWSAGPVNAFTLWSRDAIKVERGAESLATYKKTEASHRQFCTKCGGHVMTDHPEGDFTDVYAAILPTLDFRPEVHVNYASATLRVKDGLPKLKDVPSELGGTGETMDE